MQPFVVSTKGFGFDYSKIDIMYVIVVCITLLKFGSSDKRFLELVGHTFLDPMRLQHRDTLEV